MMKAFTLNEASEVSDSYQDQALKKVQAQPKALQQKLLF